MLVKRHAQMIGHWFQTIQNYITTEDELLINKHFSDFRLLQLMEQDTGYMQKILKDSILRLWDSV